MTRKDKYNRRIRVQKSYDITALGYEELYKREQFEKYGATVTNLPILLANVERLCDAGAGTLLFLEYLSTKFPQYNISYTLQWIFPSPC